MSDQVFDDRICLLGEGALWHPTRQQLFWFDILGCKLLSQKADESYEWQFDEHVSAAGWVSHDQLLIASETALFLFDIETGEQQHLCDLECDDPLTRSNDGRADPWGGFWIGTMGKNAEANLGAIYRYFRGSLHLLFDNITISNAICFSPDREFAYFTDTPTGQIMRQALDLEGWPQGDPEVFIDLRAEGLNPDGAVIDRDGCLWNAQWGAGRVAYYDRQGSFVSAHPFGAQQISCPCFGGADLATLFATSAAVDLRNPDALQGQTFCYDGDVVGQAEHQVIL